MGQSAFFERELAGCTDPEDMIFKYLRDASNNEDLAQDYSGGDNFAGVTAPDDETWVLERMILKVRGDNTGISAANYGNIAALTNGISVIVRDESETQILDLTDTLRIQNNADWGRECFDIRLDDYGSGDNFIVGRWSFFRSGSPIVLKPGRSFGLVLRDDLSTLGAQFFKVHGFKGRRGFPIT